mmetsp:Transcript_13129/g.38600  ORF Transcript_13129/g.38600 Transcript_13129/m.38600 type:complete len:219 (+) Transcript_13129:662-1318(+)
MLHPGHGHGRPGQAAQGGGALGVQSQPGHLARALPQRDHHSHLRRPPRDHPQRAQGGDHRVLRGDPRHRRGGRGPHRPAPRARVHGDPPGVGARQLPRRHRRHSPRGLQARDHLRDRPHHRHGAHRHAPVGGAPLRWPPQLHGDGPGRHVHGRRQLYLHRRQAPHHAKPRVRRGHPALRQARPQGAPCLRRAPRRGQRYALGRRRGTGFKGARDRSGS